MKIGINCTELVLLGSADRQAILKDMVSCGVQTVRFEIPWKGFALKASYADATVSDVFAAGLDPLPMVAHPPSPTPSAAAFGNAMGALAKRYLGVKHWQVWNEQNAERFWPKGNPEKFVPYLQAAYKAIRGANSSATVVLGGLAACASASRLWYQFWLPPYTNVAPREWLQRLITAGGLGYFDTVALHAYCWDEGFRSKPFDPSLPFVADIRDVRTLLDQWRLTGIPIWITEYGFESGDFTDQQMCDNAAAETSYLASIAPLDSIERAYLYTWRDADAPYGLMTKAGVHRPGYDWFRSLAK